MHRIIRTWAILPALAVALTSAACTSRDAETDTRSEIGGEVTTAVRVTDVTLGRAIGTDKRVTNETDDFRARDTIYVSIVTEGSAREARLTARWTYQDGQVVDESSQTIAPSGTTVTEFHVARPSGWPAGNYTLRVLLDGREVESEEFEVQG